MSLGAKQRRVQPPEFARFLAGPQYWSPGSWLQNRPLIAHFLQTSVLVVGSTEVRRSAKMRVGNMASSNPSRSPNARFRVGSSQFESCNPRQLELQTER